MTAAAITHRRRPAKPSLSLNLTAMIDVTFLLLVYFMVATQFKVGEELYRMDLPDRGPARAPVDPFELDEEPLRIRVASVGYAMGDYRLELVGPYPQPASFADLYDFLRRRQISETTVGGLFAADHPIIIEPTKSTQWQHALETFNAAARARYSNVTLGAGR